MKQIEWKKIMFNVLKIVIAFAITMAINTNLDKNVIKYDGNSVMYIMEFIAVYYITSAGLKKVDKRLVIITSILAFLAAGIEVVGYSINNYKNLSGIFETSICFRKSLISFVGYFCLFDIINIIIFNGINKIKQKDLATKKECNKRNLLIYWIIIFICWMPYYLNYFPGLTTSDSMLQIYQSLGISELTAHHPLIHTLFIGIFMNFGKAIGSYTAGVAIYTIVQMLIMSLIFATTVYVMKKRKLPTFSIIIALTFYSVYPVNPLFSLMMWKDILFAGVMLVYTLFTWSLVNDTEKFIENKKKIFFYTIVMILLMFFRNNGLYVIILTLPFATILLRKYWKKIVLMYVIAIITYIAVNTAIMAIFNIRKGEVREALSVPMQQIARVVSYHKSELSQEELDNINKYIKSDNIENLYNPVISDPVKNYFDSKEFSDNKLDFIKLWLRLFKKYPVDYIESFICNSYGYYYPEAKHWVANRTMEKDEILYLQSKPIIEINLVKKVDSYIERRDIPFISMMFSIGFMFWLIIISLGYCIYKKYYKYILIYVPIIMLWFTTLASPVFCEFRYVYSIVTCLPIVTMITTKNEK
ncbi:MAG: hypothetical protein IJ890_05000 [Clostridia bacterium]|nr:hypothetical protein [Clostridia bacterium]